MTEDGIEGTYLALLHPETPPKLWYKIIKTVRRRGGNYNKTLETLKQKDKW